MQLLEYNEDWVHTIEYADVGKGGIGVLVLNYGNTLAADMVREFIVRQSTPDVSFQTYPVGDMMKRYAVTAFIHAGKKSNKQIYINTITNPILTTNNFLARNVKKNHPKKPKETLSYSLYYLTCPSSSGLTFLPAQKLGSILKKCNADIKGTFTIVDCRTLTEAGKEGCRIISIKGSPEFMDYLATIKKQHQFKVLHKRIYLNGGKRADSLSSYTAPRLNHAASSQFVKGVNELIMQSASKMYNAMHAFPDKRYKTLLKYIKPIKSNTYLSSPDRTMDQPMDEDEEHKDQRSSSPTHEISNEVAEDVVPGKLKRPPDPHPKILHKKNIANMIAEAERNFKKVYKNVSKNFKILIYYCVFPKNPIKIYGTTCPYTGNTSKLRKHLEIVAALLARQTYKKDPAVN